MSICEIKLFTTWVDWASWAIILSLGSWKLFELIGAVGLKIERKILDSGKKKP